MPLRAETDRALLRADRTIERWSHAGARLWRVEIATNRVLGLACVVAGLLLLRPAAAPTLPERLVHLPGEGWVDAAGVAGLPAGVEDGDQLRWAVVGAPVEPASARRAPGEDVGASHAIAAGARLSLNEASLAELESLPGVGPVLAGRIVAARPFRTVDELDRVRGIGPKSLARLAPLVRP